MTDNYVSFGIKSYITHFNHTHYNIYCHLSLNIAKLQK